MMDAPGSRREDGGQSAIMVEDVSDNEEEDESIINPFASRMSVGKVRHRPCQANSNAKPLSVGDWHEASTPSTSSSSSVMMGGTAQMPTKRPLHLGLGTAGFLEIEEEVPAATERVSTQDLLGLDQEEVRTSSGLLLTHRQSAPTMAPSMPTYDERRERHHGTFLNNVPGTPVNLARGSRNESFEMESGYSTYSYIGTSGFGSPHYSKFGASQSTPLATARRFLSYMKLWNALFCIFLIIGTGVVIHSIRHERRVTTGGETNSQLEQASNLKMAAAEAERGMTQTKEATSDITEQIFLLPLPNATHRRMSVAQPEAPLELEDNSFRQALHALRQEFEEWVQKHNKVYHSQDEKEHRFRVWHDNHHRTIEKNMRHGPCKLSKKPVFGSTQFKDLTPEEFKAQYLTGYKGPHTDHLHTRASENYKDGGTGSQQHRRASSRGGFVPGPKERAQARMSSMWHPSVQERYLQSWRTTRSRNPFQASSSCDFYDVSCWLRWFMYTYGYGIGGTMEPGYDSDTFPEAIDWRDYGAVSYIHSQGNCGACWAITAVETIESVYALKSGTFVDLAEAEVIICDDSCEMCNGGWPQNAYDYDMDMGGLLPANAWSYDGDFLYGLTAAREGESENYDADYVATYQEGVCSDGNGNGSTQRYGKVKGYGYATDRCICYTDGTGCDCDEQNELKALQNVATYGPATVCLEASTWQDYAGGILTSDSGCSPAFLDMNHCVQAVGYAFIDSNANEDDAADDDGSGSGSKSSDGSRDDGDREGYWIIKNQWSENWGYYGYIYVAMGENTCGVLNDMTQVYM